MEDPKNQLVSIIIPVYNGEEFLKETIETALRQTYGAIEILVVDDGSSDNSAKIAESFGDQVRLILQKNQGAAAARNRGVREATGKWVAFLDSDDLWHCEKLSKQLKTCGDFSWSYTDTVFMGGVNDGIRDSYFTKKFSDNILKEIVKGNFISTSTVLVERVPFLEVGGFDESLRSIQDWELWTRLAAKYPVGYLDEAVTKYRVHGKSTSRSTRKTLPNHMRVIDKIFEHGGPAEQFSYLRSKAKAKSCGICSYIAEEEGDASFAFRCALRACRYEPTKSTRWIRAIKTFAKWVLSPVRPIN